MKFISREEEVALVHKARNGDKDAIGILWANVKPGLISKLRMQTESLELTPHDMEDLIQTMFFQFIAAVSAFDTNNGVRLVTYCRRLTSNALRQAYRHSGYGRRHDASLTLDGEIDLSHLGDDMDSGPVPDELHDTQPDVSEMKDTAKVATATLRWAKKHMFDSDMAVINETVLGEKTQSDYARGVNLSRQRVGMLRERGLKAMRSYIKKYHVEVWREYAAIRS